MARKKREAANLKRTSVQLPQAILERLASHWPDLAQSDAIRTALEQHEAILDRARTDTIGTISETDMYVIAEALEDYDLTDWRTVVRALPLLVVGLVDERQRVISDSLPEELAAMSAAARIVILEECLRLRAE